MIIKSVNSQGVAEIMNRGRSIQTPLFLFKFLPINKPVNNENGGKRKGNLKDKIAKKPSSQKGQHFFGVSFVSPKKVFKTAVERNKARRRGRSAFQNVMKNLDSEEIFITESTEMVFLLKMTAVKTDFPTLVVEIQQVLEKGGILGKHLK